MRAPRRVSTALVVTVVPCTIASISATNDATSVPSSAAISASPVARPTEGSSGVELVLCTIRRPSEPITRKSVNVPPTSIPTR